MNGRFWISLNLLACMALLFPSTQLLHAESTEQNGQETSSIAEENGWISLFDGESLEGWKASENQDTFSVVDGQIKIHGKRSHLYYVGKVQNANFKNFEFRCKVMTRKWANSGIYFHTQYKEDGWPDKGYEAQVNNTHIDPKKTGGLYNVKDRMFKSPAKDDEWFEYHIIVNGKQIILKIDGEVVTDYTEPDDLDRPQRMLSSGTFCLQGHDPDSVVFFKDIMVKVLPD